MQLPPHGSSAHRGITLSFPPKAWGPAVCRTFDPAEAALLGLTRARGPAKRAPRRTCRELDVLERLLDDLDRGGSGAVEVAGEPGIGKTRLLRELAARAEVRGHLVLGGSGSEFEHDLPFSVFVDALDEYLRGLDPERLAGLGDQVRAELRTSSRRCGRSPTAEMSRPSTSAIAAIARSGSSSSGSQGRGHWFSCWMMFTGPTPHRSNCWGRCCADRRLHPCSLPSGYGRTRGRSDCQQVSTGHIAAGC